MASRRNRDIETVVRAMDKVTKQKGVTKAQIKMANNVAAKARTKKLPRATGTMAPFSGVSEVSAAPVSLGNTVRSVKQSVTYTPRGVRVVGRDFVQVIGGTSTAFNGWCLQGGMALSPVALNASGLRGYFQTYEKYCWNKVNAHYVTSSPTSLSGDILMVYHRNHGGPKVNHASNNFLSYALSTPSALIGPQWTNHSVSVISTPGEHLLTDIVNSEDVQHQADGEILIYTKNTTNVSQADSPGYLLVDYDISFVDRMLNPRVQTLPSGVFKWFPTGLSFNGLITIFDSVVLSTATTNTYTGATGAIPTGAVSGEIFQVVFDLQNAIFSGTFSAGSQATFWDVVTAYTGVGAASAFQKLTYPLDTGTTLYAVYRSGTSFDIFPSYDAVFAGNAMRWDTGSVGAGFSCAVIMCCVGSVNSILQQANIG